MTAVRNYVSPVVFVQKPALTPVKVVATANQAGAYYNGPTASGVGANFTYASGTLTLDGQAISVGDRVLFAAQTSGLQNGIYVCVTTGAVGTPAVLVRAPDFQSIEHMNLGFFVPVYSGTSNAGSIYMLVAPKPAAVGVDALVFVKS